MTTMDTTLLLIGLLAAAVAVIAIVAVIAAVRFYRQSQRDKQALNTAQVDFAAAQEKARGHDEQKRTLEEERDKARAETAAVRTEERAKLEGVEKTLRDQQGTISSLETALAEERKKTEEKTELLQAVQGDMKAQFQNLAQEILEEKGKKFATDSAERLKPLQESVESFRKKIEDLHGESTRERTALNTHLEKLYKDTDKVSTIADDLVRAFKGSSKTQGTWGEQVLLKLLESAGLQKGENYTVQEAHTTEDGKRQILDATIKLPDGKRLIIDAKVATVAYLEYVNAEGEEARASALQRHLDAVDTHVKQLHEKNYSGLKGVNSPDFVLMFMSPESAYILALQEDDTMFARAYEKKIVITGATTLMPVLLAVANLWRLEKQQKNAEEIARQGGRLYDKVAGFKDDMEKLDRALVTARETYDKAQNKLQHGRGNILSQAEKLRELGVSSKKQLALTATEDEDGEEEEADTPPAGA